MKIKGFILWLSYGYVAVIIWERIEIGSERGEDVHELSELNEYKDELNEYKDINKIITCKNI